MRKLLLTGLCQLMLMAAFAQQKTLQGMVQDEETGQPLEGISVQVKKTKIGTLTDASGHFTVQVDSKMDPVILVISSVGFAAKEISVGSMQTAITAVRLMKAIKTNEEIIVVGYGSQNRSRVTSSISKISANALSPDKNVVSDLGKALQGRVPGLFIASTEGTPNSGKTIQIRGVQSAAAFQAYPLIVIDGLIVDNNSFNLNSINPQDVESVEVLKDAASAAIYGARGSTGVLLITTKKGRLNSKTNFSVNSYYGFNNVPTSRSVLSTGDYKAVFTESRQNRMKDIDAQLAAGGLTPAQTAQLNTEKNTLNNAINALSMADRSTNWIERVKNKNAPVNNLQVSMNGGSDQTQYYMSLGRYSEENAMGTGKFNRYSGRLDLTQKVNNWLKVGGNLAFTRNTSKGYTYPLVAGLQTRPDTPDEPVLNIDGSYGYYVGFQQHPVGIMKDNNNSARDNNLTGVITADLMFTKNLSFRSLVAGSKSDGNSYRYSSPFTYLGRPNGTASVRTSEIFYYNLDNYLTYNGKWKKLGATATWGQSFYSYGQNYYGYDLTGFSSAAGIYGPGAASSYGSAFSIPSNNTSAKEYSESYFLRGNFDWDGKYLLGASVRTDGTSKLVQKYRYSWFPSVSAGWVVSREKFFQNINFINNLKLRASYGQTGNIRPVGYFDARNLIVAGSYLNTPSLVISGVSGNEAIKWEATRQYDAGIDLSILRNRLSVIFDIYKKKTEGLLTSNFPPMSSGFSSKRDNIGAIQNTGYEVELTYNSDRSREFRWEISANIGVNRNKILSLRDSVMSYGTFIFGGPQSQIRVGQPVGSVLVLNALGVNPQTGDMMYEDVNKDGMINNRDYINVPIALPKFSGGLNLNLSYKGFDLTGLFTFVYGNKIYDYYEQSMRDYNTDFFGVMPNKFDIVTERWKQPGDVTGVPRAIVGLHGPQKTSNWNFQPSTQFIYDASYLRLRNLSLGYEFPKSLVTRMKLTKARIYMSAQNVFTTTKYIGFDPETVSNSGIVSSNSPQARSTVIGIDFSF
jgi:TonB-dependent starch-binding outer membrane protein SusC